MIFGRQSDRMEEIGFSQLNRRLDELFENKLRRFASRASGIISSVDETKQRFSSACDEFDSVVSAPDPEYIGAWNINQVRSQKSAYVTALHRIIGSSSETKHPTSYSRCSAELSSLQSMIDEVLKTNNRFKMVMLAYSKHLGNFKRIFSYLELQTTSLKRELDSVGREYVEYTDIRTHITNTSTLLDEISTLRAELGSLQPISTQPSNGAARENIDALSEKLGERRGDRNNIAKEMETTSSRMFSVLMPLQRVARLYDHSSQRRARLSDMIASPRSFLLTKEGFSGFSSMLDELKRDVETFKVKVKDVSETLAEIEKARNANLYEDATMLGILEERMRSVDDEIQYIERLITQIKSEDTKKEAHAKMLLDMKTKLERLNASVNKEKQNIEQLIQSYYKITVSIALDA